MENMCQQAQLTSNTQMQIPRKPRARRFLGANVVCECARMDKRNTVATALKIHPSEL